MDGVGVNLPVHTFAAQLSLNESYDYSNPDNLLIFTNLLEPEWYFGKVPLLHWAAVGS